ncbi:hypothetical protein I5G67_gp071 [Mycobacterium phage Aminay]|uniref:Uncharacterized protein n=1 Tax=Mycobacterium phage Aminay TaxID=2250291 RepID=A0A345KV55_9CAUD|nr:hypothetical protein I5G67_gp071 [Mycobacterium phage Aminay]AXH46907.1 hypothetical protein SEA_AMINAY_71 [Mycobacterium phage Aminay]
MARGECLIDTPMKPASCRRCGGQVLAGYVSGTATQLDPARISAAGEFVATAAGVLTYEIDESSVRFGRIARMRLAYKIRKGWPAERFVHARHRCGFVWPPALLDDRPEFSATRFPPQPIECPF